MGARAYLMVDVKDNMEQWEFIQILRKLDQMPEVDFVDPVVGDQDMVIMIEAPGAIEAVATRIESLQWVKSLKILKIVGPVERHRASKKGSLAAKQHNQGGTDPRRPVTTARSACSRV
jgi:hypothetical protein